MNQQNRVAVAMVLMPLGLVMLVGGAVTAFFAGLIELFGAFATALSVAVTGALMYGIGRWLER